KIMLLVRLSCPEKNDCTLRPGSKSSWSVEYRSAFAPANPLKLTSANDSAFIKIKNRKKAVILHLLLINQLQNGFSPFYCRHKISKTLGKKNEKKITDKYAKKLNLIYLNYGKFVI
ncbi:MAG: hypothetical protein II367_00010, partial [Treponema sp.]|nr:hypothetical protein [Treponema sp.]